MEDGNIGCFGLIALAIITGVLLAMGACDVGEADCQRLLKQEGVTQAHLNGHAWMACSKDDSFSTAFSGVKNGVPVKGAICGGWLKNYTVRYE